MSICMLKILLPSILFAPIHAINIGSFFPHHGRGDKANVDLDTYATSVQAQQSLLETYNRCLEAAPYQTKAVGTGITYMFSDATAQMIERDEKAISERCARCLKFGAVGAFWVGPILTGWFQFMDHVIPGKSAGAIAGKLLCDQLLQGPCMIGTMFAWTSIANGKSLAQIKHKLDSELLGTWINSVYVWSPVQVIQQAFVPLQYRVAVANSVSYFWDTYLSCKMMDDGVNQEECRH